MKWTFTVPVIKILQQIRGRSVDRSKSTSSGLASTYMLLSLLLHHASTFCVWEKRKKWHRPIDVNLWPETYQITFSAFQTKKR